MLYVVTKERGVTHALYVKNIQEAVVNTKKQSCEVHRVPRRLDGDCRGILRYISGRRGVLFTGADILQAVLGRRIDA